MDESKFLYQQNESTHLEQDAESSDDPEKEIYKNVTEDQVRRAREYNECFICNKRFGSFSTLRKHVVCHTNVKKFVCEICSKAFAKLTYLKAHLTTHNDNRVFTCEICSQNFATKPSIRGHMRIHSGSAIVALIIITVTTTAANILLFHQVKSHINVTSAVKPLPNRRPDANTA